MRLINLTAPHQIATLDMVLAQFPGRIFPSEAWRIDFAKMGYAVINEGVRPTCDEDTHEVLDGDVELIDGTWTQTFYVVPLPDDEVLARQEAKQQRFIEAKRQMVEHVDSHIAAIFMRWERYKSEYLEREAAARSFVAGGYAGTPDEWITDFAGPAGLAPEVAADLIISQADAVRAILKPLAKQRMAKYAIAAAVDLEAAVAAHAEIIAQADMIAASL